MPDRGSIDDQIKGYSTPRREPQNIGDSFVDMQNDLIPSVFDPITHGRLEGLSSFFSSGGHSGNLQNYNAAAQPGFIKGAQRSTAANPYSTFAADNTRGLAVNGLADLRNNTLNGPSMANLSTGRAMGSNLQSALAADGGRGVMNAASGVGAGLAQQGGMGRLAEVMAGQKAYGEGATGLRAADMLSASSASKQGLRAQGLSDQNSRASAETGVASAEAARRNALEQYKLLQRLIQMKTKKAQDTQGDVFQAIAALFK